MADTSKIKLRIAEVDPRQLTLLEENARFLRHETFQRLVENMRRDGACTSTPLTWNPEDDVWIVLSGNHRVSAAVEADLATIFTLQIVSETTPDQRLALQLSHNAIDGEDDPATLKHLYDQIADVDWKVYAGLDDKTLGMLDTVKLDALS
nr:hypothetical protein [Candidatus Dormibacteraeota bacterium]